MHVCHPPPFTWASIVESEYDAVAVTVIELHRIAHIRRVGGYRRIKDRTERPCAGHQPAHRSASAPSDAQ